MNMNKVIILLGKLKTFLKKKIPQTNASFFSIILILVIVVVAVAYAEANRCQPMCRRKQPSPIRCVREGSRCRKMRQCEIDEENCRRRLQKRPRKLFYTNKIWSFLKKKKNISLRYHIY